MTPRKRNTASRTPREILTDLDGTKHRVRIFYGDPRTGADSGDVYYTTGRISHSTGVQRVFLLINNARSTGGYAISPESVVRIIAKRGSSIVDLYRHPNYKIPNVSVSGSVVLRDGEELLRMKTPEAAQRAAAFLLGLRMSM